MKGREGNKYASKFGVDCNFVWIKDGALSLDGLLLLDGWLSYHPLLKYASRGEDAVQGRTLFFTAQPIRRCCEYVLRGGGCVD